MKEQKCEVQETAKPITEIRFRWDWTESSVWTDRMLEALENGINGVKETKWFSLMDKIYAEANLMSAYMKMASNKGSAGVDNITVGRYTKNLDKNLGKLHEQLKEGRYHPSPIRRSYIGKAGSREKRPLGIPTVKDRIVQTAVRYAIEPIFEKEFAETSYGFRPHRSCKDALREVESHLKQGYLYVLDADLRQCFDRIPHMPLLNRTKERVADTRVLNLIEMFLKQGVMEQGREWSPEEGTPQGGTLSPLLCNIYLNPLDHLLINAGIKMIRYADDFVLLCKTERDVKRGWNIIEEWIGENGLELHKEKTRLVDMNHPLSHFDFLGYRFKRTKRGKLGRFVSPKSTKKLHSRIKAKTHRCNGHSIDTIIKSCNKSLRGWFEYFKHASIWSHRDLDKWVRMRLRSILRKRAKRKGRGRGLDHHRWPNQYFANLGLFSLETARKEAASLHRS